MSEFIQPSFSSGEIAPAAFGRVDLARYMTGLRTCRNFITRVHGGVVNRPGTEFIGETFPGRFIPFIFSESQAYVLDFKDSAVRFITQGGYILNGGNLVYQLSAPYSLAQLPQLTYTKLRDVMTITSRGNDIRPKDLLRFGHNNWSFRDMPFKEGPFKDLNADISVMVSVSGTTGTVTVTTANGVNLFSAANVGQYFYIEQRDYSVPWEVGKTVAVNDIRRSEGKYYRAVDSGTTGGLRPNGEILNTFESDGTIRWEYIHSGYGIAEITGFNSPTSIQVNVLLSFPDDLTSIPSYKWAFGAWGGDQGWPGVVTYFQQRKTLKSTLAQPETLWLSGTNSFDFFGKSTPIEPDDAITIPLVSERLSEARHMLTLGGKLIVLTAGGKWILPDNDNDPTLSPSNKSARHQGEVGSASVPPVVVDDSILYVADKSQTVHDLAYQFVSNAYAGKDLSVLSKHLLEGHSIKAAAYAHVPFQIYCLIREDGVLITCTYLKEHEVWGWHRHDTTNGLFDDVCVIPEGSEDRIYFRVIRMIGGQTKYYTERLTSRLYTDVKDAFFVDSGLKYDGRNTSDITFTITERLPSEGGFGGGGFGEGGFGGSGTSPEKFYQIDSSVPYFNSSHVGDEIHLSQNGVVYRFRILSVLTISSVFTGTFGVIIPPTFLNVAMLTWVHAKSRITGFGHLEGQVVSALVDGKVHPQVVIEDGVLNLQYAGGVVVTGLPIEADLETLNLNAPTPGSILDKEKNLFAVRLMIDESRGVFAGPDADHLDEYAQREFENYDEPVNLKSGLISVRVDSTWEPGGRVFIRQSDPLPLSIIGAMPDVDIGGAR